MHGINAPKYFISNRIKLKLKLVTCAEYNRCQPYSEMLNYEHLTDSSVFFKIRIRIRDKSNKKLKRSSKELTIYTGVCQAEQLPYQAVMQPVRMLSIVQL